MAAVWRGTSQATTKRCKYTPLCVLNPKRAVHISYSHSFRGARISESARMLKRALRKNDPPTTDAEMIKSTLLNTEPSKSVSSYEPVWPSGKALGW